MTDTSPEQGTTDQAADTSDGTAPFDPANPPPGTVEHVHEETDVSYDVVVPNVRDNARTGLDHEPLNPSTLVGRGSTGDTTTTSGAAPSDPAASDPTAQQPVDGSPAEGDPAASEPAPAEPAPTDPASDGPQAVDQPVDDGSGQVATGDGSGEPASPIDQSGQVQPDPATDSGASSGAGDASTPAPDASGADGGTVDGAPTSGDGAATSMPASDGSDQPAADGSVEGG